MSLNLAFIIAVIGMILSVHMAVKRYLSQRQNLDTDLDDHLHDFDFNQFEDDEHASWIRHLNPLAQLLRPNDVEELNQLKQQLNYAGFRNSEAFDLFNAARAASLLIAMFVSLFLLTFYGTSSGLIRLCALLLLVMFLLPKFWLKIKIQQRQEAISLSLPPTLDLLVTCMEAGLNLEQAIDRVTREIIQSDPELADELEVVIRELNAGLGLSSSFKKLGQRVTSTDLSNLCNVIIQSATLGASLGRAMREYAMGARRKRELKLEEEAGKVTAKLTLPLTLCLLPSAMIAMLAPAIVTIVKSLAQ
jgi:tight adherence protein C